MEQILKRLLEIEKRLEKLEKKRTKKEHPSAVSEIKGVFLNEYEKKFKHSYPGWGAKENGMAAQWLKSVPLEAALLYAKVYPHWKERRCINAGHPFYLLVQNYVQLEAHIKRHRSLVDDIVNAKARENVEINDRVKDAEVLAHGQRYKNADNQLLADSMQEQIQAPTEPTVPGTSSKALKRTV